MKKVHLKKFATLSAAGMMAFALVNAAFASSEDAMQTCVSAVEARGAENAEEGCGCFVSQLNDDQIAEYLQIEDWDAEATGEIKAAGEACFPELN